MVYYRLEMCEASRQQWYRNASQICERLDNSLISHIRDLSIDIVLCGAVIPGDNKVQVLELMQMHPKERLRRVILTASWFIAIDVGQFFPENSPRFPWHILIFS